MKTLSPYLMLLGCLFLTAQLTGQSISLNPDNGDPGTTFTVTITGTGTTFSVQSTTTAQISNGVNNYNFTGAATSSTIFNGSLELPGDAPTGSYNATIWREGTAGTFWSCNSCFTINAMPVCSLAISGTPTDASCNSFTDGSVDITVTGNAAPVTYSWSNGSTTGDIDNLAAGNYTVTITESASCTAEMSFTVNEPAAITATASGVDLLCNGDNSGLATVVATGANNPTYLWSNGATTADISNLAGGTYYVTVTDGACQVSDSVMVLEPSALNLALMITNITMVGANDGKISATVTGGTPPYVYNWSTSDSTANISGLAPGKYFLTVTDLNQCTYIDSASIPDINCTLAINVNGTDTDCFGEDFGAATVTVTGNMGPINISWSNGATSEDISDLFAGTYQVTVTDSAGCVKSDSAIINEPSPIVITIDSLNQTDGKVFATVSGGTPPYTAGWIDLSDTTVVDTVVNATGLAPGMYILGIVDDKLCIATSDTVTIEESSSLVSPEIDAAIKAYPNPMFNQLTIDLPIEMNEAHISIYNSTGHLIRSFVTNGTRHVLIDNELPTGLIYLKISKDQSFSIRKIVKLR